MNASTSAKLFAVRSKIAGFALLPLLAGVALIPTPARSQVQPVQPKGPVPATSSASSSQTPTTKKRTTASAPTYDRSLLHPALLKEKAPEQYKVKFTTTRGEFVVVVTRSWAPLGADRFYNLVKHHFYDDAKVFRVVPNFVAQFGISSYPAVTTAWQKTDIKDDPVTQTNSKGYLTFATAGPNTRTTQVFINLKDNPGLDKSGFAPFGVIDPQGMKVVEMFYDQYGDNAGIDQSQIEKQGKAYLDKGFPKLDTINSAVITEPAPAATPAAKPKPATATKKPQ